ncbi:MAG: hypothetical protein IJ690_00820 [Clostridia bacterium]|nr:hypothetical protein [Clostridia bacterium]
MDYNMEEKPKKERKFLKGFFKLIFILVILAVLAAGGLFVLKVAPNYFVNEITDRENLVLNFSNVTGRMKHNLIVDENDVIYLSMDDIANYYDKYIYYDKEYNQIVTSTDNKLAVFKIDENKMTVNGNTTQIKGKAIEKNGNYYLPISDMEEVYNVKITKADNKVIIESLDRKSTTATASKNIQIKNKATFFSKTLEKVQANEKVSIAEVDDNSLPAGWVKVRTQNGTIGYVEEKSLSNKKVEREQTVYESPMDEKVSIAWEYFSEYFKAPDNTGITYNGVNVVSPSFFNLKLKDTGKDNLTTNDVADMAKINENVGEQGVKYINWAHQNNYKVWAKVSNETLSTTIDEFSCIINDYELRNVMINDILAYAQRYKLDGINLDFEYMYKEDNEAFSRFIIELAPQLRDKGICLSVDVTAPDGGDNWSLCYNRKLIGDVADYIVFMGYDQNGTTKIGTTSGYNWLELNINKFINNDGVNPEKIILGLPFYTKLWQTKNGETIKGISVGMNSVDNSIPASATKDWLEDVQQYYVQYDQNGYTYKMWIEDEKSFSRKMDLVNDYNLAGAGYWRKGLESVRVWNIIKEKLGL